MSADRDSASKRDEHVATRLASESREPLAARSRGLTRQGGEAVCASECDHYHTPHPAGYIQHAAWAEEMQKTHRQARCAWCGLWAVWIPKESKMTNREYQVAMARTPVGDGWL